MLLFDLVTQDAGGGGSASQPVIVGIVLALGAVATSAYGIFRQSRSDKREDSTAKIAADAASKDASQKASQQTWDMMIEALARSDAERDRLAARLAEVDEENQLLRMELEDKDRKLQEAETRARALAAENARLKGK